jgi:hypothetical protein
MCEVLHFLEVTDANNDSRVLDTSAHLLSRALTSQSASEELVHKVFRYFKCEADTICVCVYIYIHILSAPPTLIRVSHFSFLTVNEGAWLAQQCEYLMMYCILFVLSQIMAHKYQFVQHYIPTGNYELFYRSSKLLCVIPLTFLLPLLLPLRETKVY